MTKNINHLEKEFLNIIKIRENLPNEIYINYLEGVIKIYIKTIKSISKIK